MNACGRRELTPPEARDSRRLCCERHLLQWLPKRTPGRLSPRAARPVGLTTGPPLHARLPHCLLLPRVHVGPEAPFLGLSSPFPLSCLSLVLVSDPPHFPKVPNPVCPIVPHWIGA